MVRIPAPYLKIYGVQIDLEFAIVFKVYYGSCQSVQDNTRIILQSICVEEFKFKPPTWCGRTFCSGFEFRNAK
jgi:hypothetical protein